MVSVKMFENVDGRRNHCYLIDNVDTVTFADTQSCESAVYIKMLYILVHVAIMSSCCLFVCLLFAYK